MIIPAAMPGSDPKMLRQGSMVQRRARRLRGPNPDRAFYLSLAGSLMQAPGAQRGIRKDLRFVKMLPDRPEDDENPLW